MGVDVGDLTQEQLRALADLGEQMRFAVWYTGEPGVVWVRTNSAGLIRTTKLAQDGTFSALEHEGER
jgi:hypothetical protein